MRAAVLIAVVLMTMGCINVTTKTHPDVTEIQALRSSSDCAPNILGIMVGNATYDQARANASKIIGGEPGEKGPLITKVRSVQTSDYFFLFVGARCVELIGE